jgi:putative selenium metabolism protein SsnA
MLITNANLITWGEPNRILENHAIYIEGDRIKEIGPQAAMSQRYADVEHLYGDGQYVMPGNICAHTHYYGAFARGMSIPGSAPQDFPEILGKLWWPLDKALTEQDIRYSALVCLIDALKHGTTSLVDHHASPNAIPGSLDILAEAAGEAGVRSVLCYEVTDRDGEEKTNAGIAENVRFVQRARREPIAGGRVAANFGLHASLTLSDATLDRCREALPEGAGFHIHAAESDADEYDSLAKSGMRVIDRLEKHGILGPKTIVAHAVHVDAREIGLLAQSGTWVSHQPRSNMNNGVGVAEVESMMRAGVKVCLGNDGLSNTMWKEWEAAYLVQKVWNRDPRRMPASEVAHMAVTNNSQLMSVFFPNAPVGVIQPGAYADLIFVDYHPTTPLNPGNLPWHILFGFHESMITTTIVAGKVLMKNRQLVSLDEEEITARSREYALRAWKRYEENAARFIPR